ncbi:LacI family transcriptional regulator [Vibrio sp. AK197]
MATIQDVARRVGVSKSTVSKVLNGTGRVSDATKKAVHDAVKALDYRPNLLAQSLTKQTTDTIGLIIPRGYNMSQYITRLINMAQELANQAGKFLMITQVDGNDIESGIQSIHKLVDRRCDGILYYKSSQIENTDVVARLESVIDDLPIPLVVLNAHLPNKPDHCVWFDHTATARLAVDYLISQGHQRIGYITGQLNLQTSRARLQGYQQACLESGAEVNPYLIIESANCHYSGGYESCKQLIQRQEPFTALCCFNDAMAIGAMKALREHGIDVPKQVSVFGLDNDDVDDFIDPPLSSIAMPVDEVISNAAHLLFEHMKTNEPESNTRSLVGELVIRDSVQALN